MARLLYVYEPLRLSRTGISRSQRRRSRAGHNAVYRPEGAGHMPPTRFHFNGSVNLPGAETVMREIAARIPSGLVRIPDGETGDRGSWVDDP